MDKRSKWYEFYKSKMNDESRALFAAKYYPFICDVYKGVKDFVDSTGIEFGCGTAVVSHIVARRHTFGKYWLIDGDLDMLELAKENTDRQHSPELMFNLVHHDIRKRIPLEANVAYSHGVLEHFRDEDIRQIVKNQLTTAPLVINCVPSAKYKYKSYGDERLMTAEDWYRLVKPDKIESFNDGYDITLTWKRKI